MCVDEMGMLQHQACPGRRRSFQSPSHPLRNSYTGRRGAFAGWRPFAPRWLVACFYCVGAQLGSGASRAEASFGHAGMETGSVVLKQPASAAEIQPSSTVVLRCHIDGHPR